RARGAGCGALRVPACMVMAAPCDRALAAAVQGRRGRQPDGRGNRSDERLRHLARVVDRDGMVFTILYPSYVAVRREQRFATWSERGGAPKTAPITATNNWSGEWPFCNLQQIYSGISTIDCSAFSVGCRWPLP